MMASRNADGRASSIDRRGFLAGLAGTAGLALSGAARPRAARADHHLDGENNRGEETTFKIACMTLPYRRYPLARALQGIEDAGFSYVAWGTSHAEEDGENRPVMAEDADASAARELGQRCRDHGLDPVMMFSGLFPRTDRYMDVMRNRIRQAEAGGVDQVLCFGDIYTGDRDLWIRQFKELGPMARDHGVLLVIKPHGGLTDCGVFARDIVRDIDDENVKLNYDPGNVMHYAEIDAEEMLEDFEQCASEVHSFCIKDYRRWPSRAVTGPGLGEQDHYRLMHPVAYLGRDIPLCLENIGVPYTSAESADDLDAWARRSREHLEYVTQGVIAQQA